MMKPGTYWVGDLCFVLKDAWTEFCHKTMPPGRPTVEGEIELDDLRKVAYYTTANGDGRYKDQSGNSYPVDAGLIGCIDLDDILDPEAELDLGEVHQFDEPFVTDYRDGIIVIGDIRIDTTFND